MNVSFISQQITSLQTPPNTLFETVIVLFISLNNITFSYDLSFKNYITDFFL